jgi:hypothetical protein
MATQTQPRTAKQRAEAAKGSSNDVVASALWGNINDAKAYEQQIADDAAVIRGEGFEGLTRELYLKLWPLLRKPIHAGHVIHSTRGKGKPYASDGVKSVQVLIDRMDAVLTPMCWAYRETYHNDGKVCQVEVVVWLKDGESIVTRSSWGGVNQGSTQGNVYKGSFTNAAKPAFARIGPGHEIYAGEIDFDPDVNPDIAAQQGRQSNERAARGSEQGVVENKTHEQQLADFLAVEHPLQDKRQKAAGGMDILGAPARQQLQELQACPDERSLDGLLGRVNDAIHERDNRGS